MHPSHHSNSSTHPLRRTSFRRLANTLRFSSALYIGSMSLQSDNFSSSSWLWNHEINVFSSTTIYTKKFGTPGLSSSNKFPTFPKIPWVLAWDNWFMDPAAWPYHLSAVTLNTEWFPLEKNDLKEVIHGIVMFETSVLHEHNMDVYSLQKATTWTFTVLRASERHTSDGRFRIGPTKSWMVARLL